MNSDNALLELIGPAEMYFSYGQFMVFDRDEDQPGSLWTEEHFNQGFVRRQYSVGFRTLLSHGTAVIRVFSGAPKSGDSFVRVVCVSMQVPSGELHLEGPEEYPLERIVRVKPGAYRLCAAQSFIDDELVAIDLFMAETKNPSEPSAITVADEELADPADLLESGDVA